MYHTNNMLPHQDNVNRRIRIFLETEAKWGP